MTKKIRDIIFIIILISISTKLFAYRPGYNSRCESYQYDLSRIIIYNYSYNENITIKDTFPGTEFENLCKKLSEKKYLDKPVDYPTKDCSYGITIISGDPQIYCKYHGNAKNCSRFESMSVNKYYAHTNDYGILVFLGCGILAFAISTSKTVIKKVKKS